MNNCKKSKIKKIVIYCFFTYLLLIAGLYFFQRKIIFIPHKSSSIITPANLEEIYFKTEDGFKIHGWFSPSKVKKPLILYFHGNGGSLNDRAYRAETFVKNGFGLLMISYRGYGNSEGKPSELGFIEDGKAALKFLTSQGIETNNIILYGESIGSAVATQIAAKIPDCKLLVLEAPFSSILSMGKRIYWFMPISLMLKDRFESVKFAPKVQSPVLIMHANGDPVVPFAEGKILFASFNSPKRLIEIDGDFHIDLTPEFIIKEIEQSLQQQR